MVVESLGLEEQEEVGCDLGAPGEPLGGRANMSGGCRAGMRAPRTDFQV